MIKFIEYANNSINEIYESLRSAWAFVKKQLEEEHIEQRSG